MTGLKAAGWMALWCGLAAGADIRSPGKWLVDLGRDYPLTPQAGLSATDGEITLLLMRAAARLEPDRADAYKWQIDLLRVLGRDDEVQHALEAYLKYSPNSVAARLAWVRMSLAGLHTSDARADFCRAELARGDLPRSVSSVLHRQLADYFWNRGDEAEARREAETALREDPYNHSVRQFLMDTAPATERWAYHVAVLLGYLEESPGSIQTAGALGDELSQRGLAAEAEVWYDHALRLAERLEPGKPQIGLLLARAAVLMELNRLDEAEELAKRAVQAEPMTIDTRIIRAQVALLKGDTKAAEGHFRLASQFCRSTVDNAGLTGTPIDRSLLADIAWFFAHYDVQEQDASKWAQQVLATDPDNVVAHRTMGRLLARQGQEAYQSAADMLAPVVDRDLWSAIEMADIFKKAGQDQEAANQMRALATRPANFEQRHLIRTTFREWQIEFPATQQSVLDVRRLLAAYNPDKRDYALNPGTYLAVEVGVPRAAVQPGEPWWCTVRLRNVGTFPITIGNGQMVEPGFLALVETKGDRPRSSGATLRIPLDRRLRLMPGETLEVSETLDLGIIRAGMIGTPQVAQEVEVTGIVNPIPVSDPVKGETWQPGIGGLKPPPARFTRTQLRVDAGLMRRLVEQVRSGAVEERILAMEQLAMLLGESQHLASGRLRYVARPIDSEVIRPAILGMADDPDWYIRARLAECMRWFLLDSTTMPTAMKLLNDSHWLVRSLARRLLADQHGGKFTGVLETSVRTDPDDWAKQFANALLERQRAAETRPASTQPAEAGIP